MADTKITALTAITTVDPAVDVLPIVDVSDTTMAASGTTKKITSNQILGAGGTATLASATITGNLTVGNGTSATQTFSGVTNILDIGYGSLRGGSAYGDVRLWTDRFRIYNNAGTQIIKNISGTNGDETWYDGAGGTRMTLNSTGLGVGAVPTVGKVQTNGAFLTTGSIGNLSSNPTANALSFDYSSGSRIIALGADNSTAGSLKLIVASANASVYREAVTIDAAANVGVGVTPSAWNSNYKALDFGSGSLMGRASGTANNDFYLFSNAYYAASAYKFKVAAAASAYFLAAGEHRWQITSSTPSVDGNITWTQAMTLDASGNLMVGTTSVGGVNGITLQPSATTPTVVTVGSASTGGTAYLLYSTGASANRFYVTYAGTVFATNTTISAISDARFKENVQDIDVGLGAILALKPRKFDWKAGKGKDIKGDRGFIAQEFEQVFPQLVDDWADPAPEGEAPYKSVRQDLIPVLVKAIQELAAEVNALKNA